MFLPIALIIAGLLFAICTKLIFSIQTKSIKDKHIVITGGSSGIGKSIGIAAARLGAHVTILARDKTKLKAAQEEIIKECTDPLAQKIQAISLDVTDASSVEETLKKIDKDAPVFMLANCAGMAICGKLEDMPNEDIKKLIDLNYLGSVYCAKTLIPFMKERKEGIIVFTASQAAILGIYGMAVYSGAKYALRGLAESLHMELRPYNISVTVSLPPDTDTPGFETENKNKPVETHKISESAGLFKPDDVAQRIMEDSMVILVHKYIWIIKNIYIYFRMGSFTVI